MLDSSQRLSEEIDEPVEAAIATVIGAISGGVAGYNTVCVVFGPTSLDPGALHLVAGLVGLLGGALLGRAQAVRLLDTTS